MTESTSEGDDARDPVAVPRYFARMAGRTRQAVRAPGHHVAYAALGALLGILAAETPARLAGLPSAGPYFLVGSIGASAVLVFGLPQSPLSQPRNLVGGHLLAAVIGVTCYKMLPFDLGAVGALAVAAALGAMMATHTTHPPAGATALIGATAENIHPLGYLYVLTPVLSGAATLLVVGLLVNNISTDHRRHYPAHWW
ncbi:HPP family protein [Pseudonocardia dioxanivorans]|uniref:HPP family protein n=1 Tax=Pseudonocardia dioxanivorans TaxID=240495 RepID=UPI00131A572D|nr:HPP family protein [Pseudonocardia dioxanivorans]